MAPCAADEEQSLRSRRSARSETWPMLSYSVRGNIVMTVFLYSCTLHCSHAFLNPGFTHAVRNPARLALSHRTAPSTWNTFNTHLDITQKQCFGRRSIDLACSRAADGSPARLPVPDRRQRTPAVSVLAFAVIMLRTLAVFFGHAVIRPLNALVQIPRKVPRTALNCLLLACVLCGTSMTAFSAASTSASVKGGLAALPSVAALQTKFMINWRLYATIPVVAGLLNWATNKLAVNMIFYPLEFFGLKIKTWPEQPIGLIGWTGIVPVKAKPMATRMVRMVTSSLIDVKQVSRRVEPKTIADILAPVAEGTILDVGKQLKLDWALQNPLFYDTAVARSKAFVATFTAKMQDNIEDILDLEDMVVQAMVRDKRVLVELFQECGSKELRFVVNSGLYLGTLLGVFQMALWLCWDPWWSLAVGGAVVGYLTNLVAIKSIFEPVDPVKVGPFTLQGLFLTRQNEVSGQFATFLRNKCLTSEKIWDEILTGGRRARFEKLLDESVEEWVRTDRALWLAQASIKTRMAPVVSAALKTALRKEVHRVYPYMDDVLQLETEMREKMRSMSSGQFESVLHPIFEEDELTLILVGAVLGFVAGFLQSLAPY